MENIYLTVASNLYRLRKEAGLSQLALATKADIDLKTLHAAEQAKANLKLSTLEKIAFSLKVPVAHFFE